MTLRQKSDKAQLISLLAYAIALNVLVLLVYRLIASPFGGLSTATCHWDCGWYRSIAESGYPAGKDADGYASWAFFPLFPLATRMLSDITQLGFATASLVLNNALLAGTAVIFCLYLKEKHGVRDPWLVVTTFMVFPASLYFRIPYSESLFGFLTALLMLLTWRRYYVVAGLCAAAFTASRPTACLVVATLAVGGWLRLWLPVLRSQTSLSRQVWRETFAIAAFGALATIGLFAYMIYLYERTGDALAFVHIQSAWSRSFGDPLARIGDGLAQHDLTIAKLRGTHESSMRFLAYCAIASLAGIALAWLLGCRIEAVLLVVIFVTSCSTLLLSIQRYMFANPMMIGVIALGLDRLPRAISSPVLSLFAMVQVVVLFAWYSMSNTLT